MWSMRVGYWVVQARGTRSEVPVGRAEERRAVVTMVVVMAVKCILQVEREREEMKKLGIEGGVRRVSV